MKSEARRAAIYVRVSTGSQTVENQLRELRQVAERHGWEIVTEFSDKGISGANPFGSTHFQVRAFDWDLIRAEH